MPSLDVHVDGSTPFAVLLMVVSLLSVFSAALLPPLLAMGLLPIVVLTSAIMAKRHVLANAEHSPRRIERLSNGRWRLGLRNGAVVEVERLPGAFIHRRLVVAHFRLSSNRLSQKTSAIGLGVGIGVGIGAGIANLLSPRPQRWSCCVPVTLNNAEQHRLLRVMLRYEGSGSGNGPN